MAAPRVTAKTKLAVLLFGVVATSNLVQAGVIYPQPITGTSACSDRCDRTKCIEPRNCPAGLTWDRCLCCRVCARREGDRCDLGAPLFQIGDDHHTYVEAATAFASNYVHGACGTNLECKVRTDLEDDEAGVGENDDKTALQRPETTCVCVDQNPRCGNDNQTYATLCSIKEEGNIWSEDNAKQYEDPREAPKFRVEIKHSGPCQSAPKIMQPLENHVNIAIGANIMFTCDVEGFPLPQITWLLQTVGGEARTLPDGDGRISVSSRGASRPDRVTSWLQIIQVSREHEGDYSCVVENSIGGEVKSTGRLLVAKHHNHKIEDESREKTTEKPPSFQKDVDVDRYYKQQKYDQKKEDSSRYGKHQQQRRKPRSIEEEEDFDNRVNTFHGDDDGVPKLVLDDLPYNNDMVEADDSGEF